MLGCRGSVIQGQQDDKQPPRRLRGRDSLVRCPGFSCGLHQAARSRTRRDLAAIPDAANATMIGCPFSGNKAGDCYFATVARFGQQMTPDDMYQSTRLAASEAINSGITTMHDWWHNAHCRAHAEA